jgi:hypothetical protein
MKSRRNVTVQRDNRANAAQELLQIDYLSAIPDGGLSQAPRLSVPSLDPFSGPAFIRLGMIMKYALICLLLSGCLFSNEKKDRKNAGEPYYRYGIVGDSTAGNAKYLIVNTAFQQVHCEGNVLVNGPQQRLTQLYRLRGDTLDFWFLFNPEDSSMENHDVYVRSRPSAALAGQWRRIRSASANPDHAEVPDYMKSDLERRDSAFQNESMVITSDSVSLSYDRTPESRIWDLIANLPGTITYKFYGQDRTVFTKPGGAEVTFQHLPSGDLNVTSSNPADKLYVLFGAPADCPFDDAEPAWFKEFFDTGTDGEPVAKRSAGSLRRR